MPPASEKTSSGGVTVTIEKLCSVTGLDRIKILKISKLGYFPTPKKGEYQFAPAIQGLFKYFVEIETKRGRNESSSMTLPIYNSMTHCQAATGIPTGVIKTAKVEGCEAFKFARVDLAKLLPFIFREKKDSTNGHMRAPRTRLDDMRANREELKFKNENNELASKSEVKQGLLAGMAEVFSILERLFCSELPPTVVGLREMQVREKCRANIEEAKSAMKERFNEFLEEKPSESSE